MKKILLSLFILFIVSISPATQAGLLLTPTRIEMVVDDGTYLPPINLTNKGDKPLQVTVFAQWGGHNLQGTMVAKQDIPFDPQDFLTFSPADFLIGPGETRTIQTQISLPINFTAPAFYPIIYIQASASKEDKSQIATALRLSVLTLLQRDMPMEQAGDVLGVDIFQQETGQPIDFRVIFNNTGDIHTSVYGTVDIFDENQKEFTRLNLSPLTVLPGNARWIRSKWQPPMLMPGEYTYKGVLRYGYEEEIEFAGSFTVISPWQVMQRRGEMSDLKILTSTLAEGISIEGIFYNRGNVPLDVRGKVSLVGARGSKEEAIVLGEVAPRTAVPIKWSTKADGLTVGTHKLNLKLQAEEFELEKETSLLIKERPDVMAGTISDFYAKAGPAGVNFTINFSNSGTMPYELNGVIEIYEEAKLVGFIQIPTAFLVGDEEKEYKLTYKEKLTSGKYRAVITMLYDVYALRQECEFSIK